MSPALVSAVAAQRAVDDAAAAHRAALTQRDRAVRAAWESGAGRRALARTLGVSVSTVDHILDPRRAIAC